MGYLGDGVEQVDTQTLDAVGTRLTLHLGTHETDLLGQVENGNPGISTVLHALQSPLSSIAAHIVKCAHMVLVEQQFQCLGKRAVAVEMVESEPTLLHLCGQLAQTLVDGGPGAKVLQSGGTSLHQGLLEVEPAFVVHIVVEVDVDTRGGVCEQEPASLRQSVAFRFRIHQHRAYAQRRLQQTLGGIIAQTAPGSNLPARQSVGIVTQQIQNAQLNHQARDLKHHGAPGNELGEALRLTGAEELASISLLQTG